MSGSRQSAKRPLTKGEAGHLGIMIRLKSESWDQMTEAARKSPNHVGSLDRWLTKARETNPALTDEQAFRLADKLRTEHYRKMGRLSAQAKKLAKQASK